MKKIKEMIERHNTEKAAKKHGRNYKHQKYRNQLAATLKTERKKGRLKAADELLKREKGTHQYVSSLFDGRIPGKNEIKLIIQQGFLDYVCNNIMNGKFKGIDEEIAYDLLKSGRSDFVAFQLDKFEGVDHGKIAEYFFEHGNGDLVARYLYNFKGLDKEIAEKLIEAGMLHDLANHLSNFNGLVFDKDFAEKLIEEGEARAVVENLDKFEGLNHKEIAEKLIEKGKGRKVALNLDKFEGLNHKEIAEKLIEKGGVGVVAKNLDKFEGLNHKEIAEKLIEKGGVGVVAENLDKFEGLDKEIAEKMIEKGGVGVVAENLDKFEGLNHKEIAEMSIKKGKLGGLIKHLDKFEGLDEEIAKKLIEAGCGDVVEENPEKFGLKKGK